MNLTTQSPTTDLLNAIEAMVATLCGYSKDKKETAAKRAALRHELAVFTYSDRQQIDAWIFKRIYGPSYDKGVALEKWLWLKQRGLTRKQKVEFASALVAVKKTRSL